MMTRRIAAGAWSMMAAMGVAEAAPSIDHWELEWGPAWTVKGNFAKGKDLSGADVFNLGQGVAASDETRAAQRISLDPEARQLRVHEPLPLLAGAGTELDIEGAAASRHHRAYFFIGSLALARQKGNFEADRGYLFRLPVDDAFRPQPDKLSQVDFRLLVAADADLAPYMNRPAELNGLDVEGLAERDGRLFIGLRAPEREGEATILEVETDALFAGQNPPLTPHRLALGRGRGVRSLTALAGQSGFLLIVGPCGGPASGRSDTGAKFELWHWPGPGGAASTRLGPLGPVDGEVDAKAEGLLVYAQTETSVEGLIIHDGPKNGAPHGFRLTPPPLR